MKWGRYPFTNVIGERSIKFKPEGSDFEIIGDAHGIRIRGESPIMSSNDDLDAFAKSVANAFQFYQWAMRDKHGLKAKPTPETPKIVLPEGD